MGGSPLRKHVIDYLSAYERRYDLGVLRPHRVTSVPRVHKDPDERLLVTAPGREVTSRVVILATGTRG